MTRTLQRLTVVVAALFVMATSLLAPPPSAKAAPQTLLSTAATTWHYLDDGTDPGDSWATPTFDDSAWKQAKGSFGAVRGAQTTLSGGFDPTTLLAQYYPDTTTNKPSFFFRTTLTLTADHIATATRNGGFDLQLRYDDAAAVFVNGVPATQARFDWDDAAGRMDFFGSNASAPKLGTATLPASLFRAGDNMIAVELHNGRESSSDIYLDVVELSERPEQVQQPFSVSYLSMDIGATEADRGFSWVTPTGFDGVSLKLTKGDATRSFAATKVPAYIDGADGWQVSVTGLDPHATYSYQVGVGEQWTEPFSFTTGTFAPGPIKFLAYGDPQIGASGDHTGDGQGWRTTVDRSLASMPDAEMLLSVGDQVNAYAGRLSEYDEFFSVPQLKKHPLISTIGNHDSAKMYEAMFSRPNLSIDQGVSSSSNAAGNYWFKHRGVLFVNINSNDRNNERHGEYLKSVLDLPGNDVAWKVLIMHHNTYSSSTSHSQAVQALDRQRVLMPIVSKLGFKLVLNGHDHIYTRAYLANANGMVNEVDHTVQRPKQGDVLYVTLNSASGSKFYTQSLAPEVVAWSSVSEQTRTPNWTEVSITDERITLITYAQGLGAESRVKVDEVVLEQFSDETAPVLTVPEATTITAGNEFDPMAGVTAVDDRDGDITDRVSVTGSVDVATPGSYELTYTVADKAGNEATVRRSVTVVAAPIIAASTTAWQVGDTVEVSGANWAPGSSVALALHSDPVAVGTATADNSGAFTLNVVVPDVTAGAHTLVATDDRGRIARLEVVVRAAQSATPSASPSASVSASTSATPSASATMSPTTTASSTASTSPTASPSPAPGLPNTGAADVTLAALLGLLVIAGGVRLVRGRS